jgi:hypothetical protein
MSNRCLVKSELVYVVWFVMVQCKAICNICIHVTVHNIYKMNICKVIYMSIDDIVLGYEKCLQHDSVKYILLLLECRLTIY